MATAKPKALSVHAGSLVGGLGGMGGVWPLCKGWSGYDFLGGALAGTPCSHKKERACFPCCFSLTYYRECLAIGLSLREDNTISGSHTQGKHTQVYAVILFLHNLPALP